MDATVKTAGTEVQTLEESLHALAGRLANTAQVLTAWSEALPVESSRQLLLQKRLGQASDLIEQAVASLSGRPAQHKSSPLEKGADGSVGMRGRSELISLVEFVGFLASLNRDGVLTVTTDQAEFVLQIEQGSLVYASSDTPPGGRVGERMAAAGLLQREDLDRALRQRQSNELLGDTLLRLQLVDPETLREALTEQITEMFCRMHQVGTGFDFEFTEGSRIRTNPDLRLNISHLLLESARQRDHQTKCDTPAEPRRSAGRGLADSLTPAPEQTDAGPYREYIQAKIQSGDLQLPALPHTTGQMLAMCWQPEVDSEKLAECVAGDQALCAHLLRVANSAAYSPVSPITSVQLAITRLGVGKIREICLALTLDQQVFQVPGWKNIVRALWRTAAITAGFADRLGARCLGSSARGNLVGLLQDIGKPIVLGMINELGQRRGERLARTATVQLLDEFHQAAGARLAQHWQLPEWLCTVIANHHNYKALQELREEALVAFVAYQLALWAQGFAHQNPDDLQSLTSWKELGLNDEDRDRFVDQRDRILELAKVYD